MEEIRKELQDLAEEKLAEFNRKLCPDTSKKILGVRIPKIRKLAKKIVKEMDWKNFLENADENCFEEVILEGMVIGYAEMDFDERLEYIKKFVPKIDSWEICDTFCPSLKSCPQNLDKMWKFILLYLDSKEEFEVRFAVIMMLDYYIKDEYVDEVIQKLDRVSHEAYYAKMAVSWCLAEIGVKYNEKAMAYLQGENHLDKFTFNKALQKMRESYRIDEEQKVILKKMKK